MFRISEAKRQQNPTYTSACPPLTKLCPMGPDETLRLLYLSESIIPGLTCGTDQKISTVPWFVSPRTINVTALVRVSTNHYCQAKD